MHNKNEPNLIRGSMDGQAQNFKISPMVYWLVGTHSLNMVTLEFFFPHNVMTWAHFFHKKPFVPFTPAFCLFFGLPKLQQEEKQQLWVGLRMWFVSSKVTSSQN